MKGRESLKKESSGKKKCLGMEKTGKILNAVEHASNTRYLEDSQMAVCGQEHRLTDTQRAQFFTISSIGMTFPV